MPSTQLVDHLTGQLITLQPDGIALSLHGAMVSEVDRDGDGWILEHVREAVGWDIPVVAELDLHANISSRMIEAADILVGYDTYPHIDMAERGCRGHRPPGADDRRRDQPGDGHGQAADAADQPTDDDCA